MWNPCSQICWRKTVVGKNDERFAQIGLVYWWWIPWWNSVKRNHQLNTQKRVLVKHFGDFSKSMHLELFLKNRVPGSSQWPFLGVLSDLFRSESRDLHLGGPKPLEDPVEWPFWRVVPVTWPIVNATRVGCGPKSFLYFRYFIREFQKKPMINSGNQLHELTWNVFKMI